MTYKEINALNLKHGSFYWVKLKPYKDSFGQRKVPDWEPMMWDDDNRDFLRVGVIYSFRPKEVLEIGREIRFSH